MRASFLLPAIVGFGLHWLAIIAPAADWPGWRGPTANNHSHDSNPPTRWTSVENIAWKIEVPGRGHASPCVVGDRIVLASADDEGQTQFLLCFDRSSGKLLWRTLLHDGPLPAIHANNSHASATPACDGEAIYTSMVSDGQLWVSSVAINGDIRWQKSVGAYKHANGFGASPVLYGDTIIVASDNQAESFIVALALGDGQIAWQVERPKSDNSATPIVANVSGRDQLLINGAYAINSYDPATGFELWHVTHGCEVVANTMTFDEKCVYASGNVPDKMLMAVRADGTGDVTNSHVLWHLNRQNPYVPSPLIVGAKLITVLDNGIVYCRAAATGTEIWHHRLSGNFFSSPVLAGNKVYVVSDAGTTFVFDATDEFASVTENNLEEGCMATPAICDDEIYLRTLQHLICIRTRYKRP
jgi:outer membrane protein assembly factor BamB